MANAGIAIGGFWHDATGYAVLGVTAVMLGGFVLFAMLVLGRALPAMGDAFWVVEARGPMAEALRHAFRSLVWAVAGIAVFQTAISLQGRLFGFFLPP